MSDVPLIIAILMGIGVSIYAKGLRERLDKAEAEVKRLREEVAILESEVVRRDARIALLSQPSDSEEP